MPDPAPHRWTLDAVEEGIARLEVDGSRVIHLPAYLLPAGAREGQILRVTTKPGKSKGALDVTIEIDEAATAAALARSSAQTAAIMATSKKRDPGGDVAL